MIYDDIKGDPVVQTILMSENNAFVIYSSPFMSNQMWYLQTQVTLQMASNGNVESVLEVENAANGNSWNITEQNIGGTKHIIGTDSKGNSVNCMVSQFINTFVKLNKNLGRLLVLLSLPKTT